MGRVAKLARLVLANIVVVVMGAACQASSSNSSPLHSPAISTSITQAAGFQQLMIKFKPNTIECDADGIARLSFALKVQFEYVRVMSGQACVIRQLMDKEGGFSKGQILLRQHPDVEWLELDAIMKTS